MERVSSSYPMTDIIPVLKVSYACIVSCNYIKCAPANFAWCTISHYNNYCIHTQNVYLHNRHCVCERVSVYVSEGVGE